MQTCNCCELEFNDDGSAWGQTCGECLESLMKLSLICAEGWQRKPVRRARERDIDITIYVEPLAA